MMGWTSDEEGETSAHASESDGLEDIRPLKKARYVWQIKGKYHLKKSEEERATVRSGPVRCTCNNCPSVSADVEMAGPAPGPAVPTTIQPFIAPATVITAPSRLENSWQLCRWQARQVARCFVDNTINRVLEDMGLVPFPPGNGPPSPLLEEAVDSGATGHDQEGHVEVEDEAVLMAIHSHGLQRPSALLQQNLQRMPHIATDTAVTLMAEPSDFLDTAVAVAIQKKGLGTITGAAPTDFG